MTTPPRLDRRTFLADLGHGAFAIALVSIVGCSPTLSGSPSPRSSTPVQGSGGPSPAPTSSGGSSEPPAGSPPTGGVSWERVNLGFVSAYLLVRNGEAALVDTGVAGSTDAIGAALTAINLDWPGLGHVILTHRHNDHAGSIRTVLDRATGAVAYAGAEDISGIAVERPVTAVADGESVFDLRIVTAPGHTAGSICVLDPIAGVLVAGDALRTAGGRPQLPGSDFTEDMTAARQSVAKLGGLAFETLLVGHGDPIQSGASAMVAELATNNP